ncbi:MAG: hypothetical protein FWD90_13905 [Defluviitaleaceae bacterium]|nr:hypothetical protein [Defluviitaleaceae bacterium]
MSNTAKSIMFIHITLLIGVMVYILLKPPLSWMPNVGGWDKPIINITWMPKPISDFILYHLSDVLWALAFAETVFVIKRNLCFVVLIVFTLTVVYEAAQYIGIVKGTGDIRDIIFVAFSLSIYYKITKGRGR